MLRSKSIIATPPGTTIKEQLEDRGMTQKDFAARMGMSEKHISQLINGDVRLTPETAEKLEMVFGIPARFWNNLEAIYQEKLIKAQAENEMDEEKEVCKKFPYRELEKEHWVPEAKTTEDKIVNLRKFFEVARLKYLQDTELQKIACRKLGVTEKSDFALIAWVQDAKREAREISVKPLNRKKLRDALPEIRRMTTQRPEVFCPRLREILSECGIALVFLPHISGSFLHGATFYDGKKVVMGLTVRGKDADKFWFSLFHEISHVLESHIDKEQGADANDEKQADRMAADILIEPSDYAAFVHSGQFDADSIRHFANKCEIDEGIVVGRLQNEGLISYSWHNGMKKKYTLS